MTESTKAETKEKQVDTTTLNNLQNELNNLKESTDSENEKTTKAKEIQKNADYQVKKIQESLNSLEGKTDAESLAEAETLKQQLELYNNIISESKAIQHTETESSTSVNISNGNQVTDTGTEGEKGFFGKAWDSIKENFGKAKDWIGEQWDSVRDKEKWEKEGGKNILRTTGFVVTGVGAVALAIKGIKELFGDDDEDEEVEDEEDEEESSKKKSKKKKKTKKSHKDDDENEEDEEEEDDDDDESSKKKSKKKKKTETSRWKKFFWGSLGVIGATAGGVWTYKHWNKVKGRFKDKLGLNLSFDEAKQKVEEEVRNGINSDDHFGKFSANFTGIEYDKNKKTITSYGQETKIDYENRKLEGMDVEFPNREELIHAANLVNFTKRALKGRGANSTPFSISYVNGDISFNEAGRGNGTEISASDSSFRGTVLGTSGVVIGGLLGAYIGNVRGAALGAVGGGTVGYTVGAIVDEDSSLRRMCDTIKNGNNLQLFINYLNRQQDANGKSLWEGHEQVLQDESINPMQKYINSIIKEIQDTFGNGESDGSRRQLQVDRSETNPEIFTIGSYNHKVKLKLEGCSAKKGNKGVDFTKIKKIHLEKYDNNDRGDGLDINFPHTEEGLKEAIRTANLTNKIREDFKGKGGDIYPFYRGRYKTPFSLEMDVDGFMGKTIVERDTLSSRFPTLFEDLKKGSRGGVSSLVSTHSHMEDMYNQAKNDKNTGSQYIKYLHQMRDRSRGYRESTEG